MMGTADSDALKEPTEKVVFVEDMSDAQLATAVWFLHFASFLQYCMRDISHKFVI